MACQPLPAGARRIMGALWAGELQKPWSFGHAEVDHWARWLDIRQVPGMARQNASPVGMSDLGPVSLEGGNQEVFLGPPNLMTPQ